MYELSFYLTESLWFSASEPCSVLLWKASLQISGAYHETASRSKPKTISMPYQHGGVLTVRM